MSFFKRLIQDNRRSIHSMISKDCVIPARGYIEPPIRADMNGTNPRVSSVSQMETPGGSLDSGEEHHLNDLNSTIEQPASRQSFSAQLIEKAPKPADAAPATADFDKTAVTGDKNLINGRKAVIEENIKPLSQAEERSPLGPSASSKKNAIRDNSKMPPFGKVETDHPLVKAQLFEGAGRELSGVLPEIIAASGKRKTVLVKVPRKSEEHFNPGNISPRLSELNSSISPFDIPPAPPGFPGDRNFENIPEPVDIPGNLNRQKNTDKSPSRQLLATAIISPKPKLEGDEMITAMPVAGEITKAPPEPESRRPEPPVKQQETWPVVVFNAPPSLGEHEMLERFYPGRLLGF